MHGGRRKILMCAVEALIGGHRLTLTDLSRSWPDATFAHAPLKALDRLLSNRHLHGELDALHRAMAAWLMPEACPVIVVGWSDLKGDGRWCLLRAAVPVGGRTLAICECIHPIEELNVPQAQRAFLEVLAQIIPVDKRPIIVSDAGGLAVDSRHGRIRVMAAGDGDQNSGHQDGSDDCTRASSPSIQQSTPRFGMVAAAMVAAASD